jgi:hypothetical protein
MKDEIKWISVEWKICYGISLEQAAKLSQEDVLK